MPWYDMKCSWCEYEAEVKKGPHDVLGCNNPDRPGCPGVMDVQFKTAPGLTHAACPSRNQQADGVKYRVVGEG